MQLITFIPASDENLKYQLEKVLVAIAGPPSAKQPPVLKLIPGFAWGVTQGYKEGLKEYISKYLNEIKKTEYNEPFPFELKSGDLGIAFFNPRKFSEIKKDFEKGLFSSELRFMSSPVPGNFYFLQPVYATQCSLDHYYRFIFLEKLYFWKKILVELGAKTIKINAATENTEAFFDGFAGGLFLDELSGKYGDSKEQRNMMLIEKNSIFSQTNNEPDEKYMNIREEDFNQDGQYIGLFRYEKNVLDAYKSFQWIYNDDRELEHIFETRLRQLLTNKQGNLDFYVKCKFEDIGMTKENEEILSDFGFMKTQFSSINKNKLFMGLKISF